MSNKTLKENAKKTKWAPNKLTGILLVALLTVIVYSFFSSIRIEQASAPNPSSSCGLELSTGCYQLEYADTEPKRIKGLSGRDKLDQNNGVLFVFNQSSSQCIWMKDMKFSIDILWLDHDKKVTKHEENVSPDTYPTSYCQRDTKYVIELNSGDIQKNDIRIGQQLVF